LDPIPWHVGNVVRLDVSSNNIASLESLALLINLKVLDVSHNSVRAFPHIGLQRDFLDNVVRIGPYNLSVVPSSLGSGPHNNYSRFFVDCAECGDVRHVEHPSMQSLSW